jgi:PAS domain S-box-containing protein
MGNDTSWPQQRIYRLLFEQAREATFVVDDDGRVLLSNRLARELPGVDAERLLRWSPCRDAVLTSFRAELRVGGRAVCELELSAPDKAPRYFVLEGTAQGSVYFVVLRDVTERRREQAELRRLRRLEAAGTLASTTVIDRERPPGRVIPMRAAARGPG